MQGYESYELSNQDVATAAAKLFEGLSRPELHNLVTDIPRLEDIRPCIRILKEAGVECLVATITFDFAAEWFASEYGFDGYSGIQLEFDSKGLATGNISKHFDENDKAEFIKREYRRRGLACDRVFYVGDSRSDLPTFSIVGHSVALNATPEAIRKATTHANGKSLVDALVTIPGLEYMISNLRFGH
jgi:HAD superfamily phosphoserine phosphatase-like hydrolase